MKILLLYFVFSLIIPLSTLISLKLQGAWAWTTPLVAFGLLPIFEAIVPLSSENPVDSEKDEVWFHYLAYFMLPLQYYLLFEFGRHFSLENPMEALGQIFSLGICCGVIGINVGHELGHRQKSHEVLFAKLLLCTSLYEHFYVEHNKGHHRHVATERDPATARLNQNLYSFWYQSVTGSLRSALKIDKNEVFRWFLFEFLLVITMGIFFGGEVLLGFLASAFVGILLLETVNYIEHYGLMRKVNPSGRFEKVNPTHSWNSDHPISRYVLFNLSRHSDHHAHAERPYYLLRSFEDSPQLPTGYPGMILLALVPPLYFKVMNPLVKLTTTASSTATGS